MSVWRVWPAHQWEECLKRGRKGLHVFPVNQISEQLLSKVKHRSTFYSRVYLLQNTGSVLTLEYISLLLMFGLEELLLLTVYFPPAFSS